MRWRAEGEALWIQREGGTPGCSASAEEYDLLTEVHVTGVVHAKWLKKKGDKRAGWECRFSIHSLSQQFLTLVGEKIFLLRFCTMSTTV